MEKPTPKKASFIGIVMLAVGAAIGYIGAYIEIFLLVGIGLALMIFSLIWRVIFYRCPHCNKYLDRSSGEFCPYCGKEVNKK